ncbi:Protein of unknown function, partial [Cotesia congregata]
ALSDNNNSSDSNALDNELKQTYEYLKDIEAELLEQKNEFISLLSKNPIETVSPNVKPEDIEAEQLKFVKALVNEEQDYDDRIRPIKNSVDVFTSLDSALLQEISDIQTILDQTKVQFLDVKKSISSLMSEKNNLQKMKDMCSDAVENVDAETTDIAMYHRNDRNKIRLVDLI